MTILRMTLQEKADLMRHAAAGDYYATKLVMLLEELPDHIEEVFLEGYVDGMYAENYGEASADWKYSTSRAWVVGLLS